MFAPSYLPDVALGSIFVSAILPVVAVAGVGYLFGVVRDVDAGPLAAVSVHVLTPALAFHSIATTELAGGTIARVALGLGAFVVAMAVLAELAARLVGIDEPFRSAIVLFAAFSNSGNYGVPVSEFAFGAVGRSTALVYMTAQIVCMYTVGVYVAARSSASDWTEGVRRVVTVPLVYAVAAALVARRFSLLPAADGVAMETVGLVGDAAIPMMLIVLGLELARSEHVATLRATGTVTALRLGVAPALSVGVALLLDFGDPTVARTFVLESATPAAVIPLVLLVEFGDTSPVDGVTVSEFAGTVVLVTTLLSVATVTVLVGLLRSGLV